jgi:hypothetical protein
VKYSGTVVAVASCTVQVAVEALDIIRVPDTAGRVQVKPESGTAGTTVKPAVCEAPL